ISDKLEQKLREKLNPDLKAHIDSAKLCLEGTRVEITNKISQWIYSTGTNVPRIFFLHGPAGTGKSAIAHTIGKYCKDWECLGAFFRFDRIFAMKQTPSQALQSIAYNMAINMPEFGNSLMEILDEDPYILSGTSLQEQWENLILKPAQSVHESKPVVVIIDALDECGRLQEDNPRRKLLSILINGVHQLPQNFCILLTSRLEIDIVEILDKYASQLEIQDISDLGNTKNDIYKYVVYKMESLIAQGSFNLNQCEVLAQKAEKHFQWAYTVCRALEQQHGPGVQINDQFEKLIALQEDVRGDFDPLDQLYKSILDGVLKTQNKNAMKEYQKVVSQILAASEPLSKSALQNLQTTYSHYMGENDYGQRVDGVISWLGSIFTGINDWNVPIQPVHTSVRDFLLDKNRSGIFAVEIEEGHKIMGAGSIQLMTEQLHINMCNLPSSYLRNSEVENLQDLISFGISPEMSYACCFWDIHFGYIPCNEQMLSLLKHFIIYCSLFWMEVLSILNRTEVILRGMDNMIEWMEAAKVSKRMMGKDIKQCVYIFGKIMVESTPHLYVSALPFLPAQSMLGKVTQKQFHNIARICKGHKKYWPSLQAILAGHRKGITSVAFAFDGRRIVSGSMDYTVRIWDAETGNAIGMPLNGHTGEVLSVAFSPDGKKIVSGSSDCTVRIWDADTGNAIGKALNGHKHQVQSVAFSPDGRRIVSGSSDCTIQIWDAETGNVVGNPLNGHKGPILSVSLSLDGRRIVSGSSDRTARIWDAETGNAIGKPLTGHKGQVHSVAFSPDGRKIASGSSYTVRIWDVETGDAIGKPLDGHKDWVQSVAFSPDGRRIVSGSSDCTVRIWSAESGSAVGRPLYGHKYGVWSVDFSPNGRRIVSGSFDCTVRIWDADTEDAIGKPLNGHKDQVWSVAFSPDGKRIVSGSSDCTVHIWDADTAKVVGKPLIGHKDQVWSVAFSPDGSRIVSGSKDCTVRIWDAESQDGTEKVLNGHKHWVLSVAFSPDGRRIVSGSSDCTIRMWDVETGGNVGGPLNGHKDWVQSVAFSPDGKRIVSGSSDCTIRIWNAETLRAFIVKPLEGHEGPVQSVSFSPNGRRIVSGSSDCTMRIWNAATGTAINEPLHGHQGQIQSVAYSPDGRRIVSGSKHHTVQIWDADTGNSIGKPLNGHKDLVWSVAFSPDGRKIVSGSFDCTVRIWDATIGDATNNPLPQPLFSNQLVPSISHGRTNENYNQHSHLIGNELSESNLTYSLSFCSHLDHSNGWICGSNGHLLVWTPPEYQTTLTVPPLQMEISDTDWSSLDMSHFTHGKNWAACFTGSGSSELTDLSTLIMESDDGISTQASTQASVQASIQAPPSWFRQVMSKLKVSCTSHTHIYILTVSSISAYI
ncbi:hypothetical protein GYMLUDRAFT_160558, partial [Collybiopsis luxurians FD-317 M1]